MSPLFSILLLLASAFTFSAFPGASANPGSGTPFDTDTYYHHGYSTAEMWVGRSAINVGDLIGSQLYDRMLHDINSDCHAGRNWCEFDGAYHRVPTHYVKNLAKGDIGFCYFSFVATGKWETEEHRQVLIRAVAKTMEALTSGYENCYDVPRQGKFCNLGDFIRVNLPASPGKENHMWVRLYGDYVTKEFKCCPTRNKVDGALDGMKDEFELVTHQKFSRTVWCLIDHQLTCGECGPKCDTCGASCPDVCPKGRC